MLTVGENKIDYPDNVSTPKSDLITAKLIINSTLSSPNNKRLVADIKNFYLNKTMNRFEYMQMKYEMIPKEISKR